MSDYVRQTAEGLVFDLNAMGITADDIGFKNAPNGTYNLRVTQWEAKESRAGNTYFKLGAQILDGEHAGKMAFDNINLVGKTPEKTKQSLSIAIDKLARILGEEPKDLIVDGVFVLPTERIVGAVFNAKCENETFNGFTSLKIKTVMRDGGAAISEPGGWDVGVDEDEIPL